MSSLLLLALALSMLIGLSLGLLGGGGSILTVPILVYALGVEPKEAIATSLLVVGITSVAAVVPHARAGAVRWRTGIVFGAAGMVGAFAAGRVAHFIPAQILLVAFAAMMLVTAVAMLRGRKTRDPQADAANREIPVATVLAEGLVVGAVTGLVGAGGGFLVVPALVLLGGLPMRAAVGTSLVVIAMKSFAGFAGYLGHVHVDWSLAAIVSGSAVLGSVVGGRFAERMPQESLRHGFGWFVVVMGTFMMIRQAPEAFGIDVEPMAIARALAPWAVGIGGSIAAYFVGRQHGARRSDSTAPSLGELQDSSLGLGPASGRFE